MKKYIVYTCITLVSLVSFVSAQTGSRKSVSYFKIAEKEFLNKRYAYAIPFYKYCIDKKLSTDSTVMMHLADAYWFIKKYDSALYYYQKFEEKYPPVFHSGYHIAELLAIKKEYSKSAGVLANIAKKYPGTNDLIVKERAAGFSNTAPFLKDSLDYTLQFLKLNTGLHEFSLQYYQGGIVFISNRFSSANSEKEFGWDASPYANIYRVRDTADLLTASPEESYSGAGYLESIKANDDYTAKTSNDNDVILWSGAVARNTSGVLHKLEKFGEGALNTKFNYGPLCFNKAGNVVYFTRNTLTPVNKKYTLEICSAALVNGVWTNVRVMPFVNQNYDFFHPALSSDESKLYFCSNQAGGAGGTDIYFVSLQSEEDMKTPVNAGTVINTAGNELFPTIHGEKLYYSSDGLAGLGGLDIYESSSEKGKWSKPKNIGYPVNSSYDDFGLIWNASGKKGFFATNRMGSDDIYMFAKETVTVTYKGYVLNKASMLRLEKAKVVLYASDEPGAPAIDSVITDHTGNYQFHLRPGTAYTIKVTKPDFSSETVKLAPANGKEQTVNASPVLLAPDKAAEPVKPADIDTDGDGIPDKDDRCPTVKGIKENLGCPDIQKRINELAKIIYFKTASDELTAQSLVPLNEVVSIIKEYPTVTLTIEGHTDNRAGAAYNKLLSQRRANRVRTFFIKNGIGAERLQSAGYGFERPIADNKTEEGRAKNRRVQIMATFH